MKSTRLLWIGPSVEWPVGWGRMPEAWVVDFLSPRVGLEELRRSGCAAVIVEDGAEGWPVETLLEEVGRLAPDTPRLAFAPGAEVCDAVRLGRCGAEAALAGGAGDVAAIERSIEGRRLFQLAALSEATAPTAGWRNRFLIGESPAMRRVCHTIEIIGPRKATVLITGETGSGKEMAARALHAAGPRHRGPFVAVNCGAIPEHLLEDELFGHVKGAFTGAIQNRAGRFEQAQGGMVFLDEIGELPVELQAKLLRVLQEREYQRLGSSETIRTDARVVAASNRDLEERVEQGRFREDLFYRLNVVPIEMPPLRDRREDIPRLASHFAAKIAQSEDMAEKSFSQDAVERLCGYAWPGNVRQLENAVEMAAALSGDRAVLTAQDFPLQQPRAQSAGHLANVFVPEEGLDFERTVGEIERSILEQALRLTGGNKKAAADILRLKRTTLSAKVRSLESSRPN